MHHNTGQHCKTDRSRGQRTTPIWEISHYTILETSIKRQIPADVDHYIKEGMLEGMQFISKIEVDVIQWSVHCRNKIQNRYRRIARNGDIQIRTEGPMLNLACRDINNISGSLSETFGTSKNIHGAWEIRIRIKFRSLVKYKNFVLQNNILRKPFAVTKIRVVFSEAYEVRKYVFPHLTKSARWDIRGQSYELYLSTDLCNWISLAIFKPFYSTPRSRDWQ